MVATLRFALVAVVLAGSGAVQAEVKTKVATYTHEGVTMRGYFAWDDAVKGPRPGVLVVHEWWGLNDYAKRRAEDLAKLGYIAFACDMYGDGKTTEHPSEAKEFATAVRKNQDVWVGRAKAGLKQLAEHELAAPAKLAAIGYCFGGSTVMQLAYSGADLKAIASFHGAVVVPTEAQAKAIKAKFLICHGALDSFIPEESLQKTRAALDHAKADYQMIYYGGAVHSFTVPGIDKLGVKGLAYNADADRRSWREMRMLFNDVFQTNSK